MDSDSARSENDADSKDFKNSLEGIAYRMSCRGDATLEAEADKSLVVKVLSALSKDVRDRILEKTRFIIPTGIQGVIWQEFIPRNTEDVAYDVVLLNFSKSMPIKMKTTIIAHEIAHCELGHAENGSQGWESESAADDLCESWGFGRAYKSRSDYEGDNNRV